MLIIDNKKRFVIQIKNSVVFGESQSRVVVSVKANKIPDFEKTMAAAAVKITKLGKRIMNTLNLIMSLFISH